MTVLNPDMAKFDVNDKYAVLKITGTMSKDGLDHLRDTIESDDALGQMVNLLVIMEECDFDGLSPMSEAYNQLRNLLRFTPALEKVALVSDSAFLRNSAKIAGATTPGLTLSVFTPKERAVAESWLKDEPVSPESAEEDKPSPAQANEEVSTKSDSDNPWDNLNVNKLSA